MKHTVRRTRNLCVLDVTLACETEIEREGEDDEVHEEAVQVLEGPLAGFINSEIVYGESVHCNLNCEYNNKLEVSIIAHVLEEVHSHRRMV